MKRLLIVAALTALPMTTALAGDDHDDGHKEHTQLSAHMHGEGKLNIAIEGKTIKVELMAPSADIVGFEYAPKTKKEKAAVADAKAKLEKASSVIELTSAAGCSLTNASVDVEREDEEEHAAHSKAKKSGHSDGHSHAHDHGKSAKKADEAVHSEFHAEYEMTCSSTDQLAAVTFAYFKNFSGAKELDVSVVGPKGQQKFEVTAANAEINLGGMM
ncbi:MAG: DUF2796 domain-containing protein [Pseudomonadota bacterium]